MKRVAALRGSWREPLATMGVMALIGCGGPGSGVQQSPPPVTPTITSASPSYDFAGQLLTVAVTGTGFDSSSTLRINGVPHATTFVSNVQVTCNLTSSDVAQPGTIDITVANADGQVSSSFPFQVMDLTKSAIHAVSVKTDGTQDQISSHLGGDPWISANGRYVAFTLYAPILGLGLDTPAPQAFVRDTCNTAPPGCQPSTTLVAIYPDGSPVNNSSTGTGAGGISSDGRFVSFNTDFQIFLRDTCAGASQTCVPQTYPVSDTPGSPATGNFFGFAPVSGNGRYVSFQWNPGNGSDTVYVTDTCAGAGGPCTPSTQEVTFANDGTFVGGVDSALSADGRYVAFLANRDGNIYVRDLCNGVSAGCTQQDIWIGPGGVGALGNVRPMSPDGRYLVLIIDEIVDGYNVGQVYVQDTCIGTTGGCVPSTTIASVADDGTHANLPCDGTGITANGRFVIFSTAASNLVPNDTNTNPNTFAGEDMFVRDTCIGAVNACNPQTVRISLAADGSQADQPLNPSVVISADGSYAAFGGYAQLVPGLLPNSENVFIVRNGAYLSILDRASSTRQLEQSQGNASSHRANELHQ